MNQEMKVILTAEIDKLKKNMDNAKKQVQKFSKDGVDKLKKFGEAAKKAGEAVKKGMKVVATAIAAGIAAMAAVSASTEEFRNNQAKLVTAFEAAGSSAEQAAETYKGLYRVLGDDGQATEAAQHLAKLSVGQKELAEYTRICQGVYATFGDSLAIEGLTEAINHTAKLGEVQGTLADALEWSGINVDDFNKKLAACNTEAEREALIRQQLNELYGDAADKYEKNNQAILKSHEAQLRFNTAMAGLGAAFAPIQTALTNFAAALLEQVVPYVQQLSDKYGPALETSLVNIANSLPALIDWFISLKDAVQPIIEKFQAFSDKIGVSLGDLTIAIIAVTGLVKVFQLLGGAFQWVNESLPFLLGGILGLGASADDGRAQMQGWKDIWIWFSSFFTNIPGKLAAIGAAITGLNVPMWAVIAIIALVGGAIYGIVTNWDAVKAAAISAWETISSAVMTAWETIKPYIDIVWTHIKAGLESMLAAVTPVLDSIVALFAQAWELIQAVWVICQPFFQALWDFISQAAMVAGTIIGGALIAAWEAIVAIWNTAAAFFQAIIDTITGIFAVVTAVLSGDFQSAWDAIKGIFATWGTFFQSLWANVTGIFTGIDSWFSDLFGTAWENIKTAFSAAGTWFGELFNTAVTSIKTAFQPITQWFTDIYTSVTTAFNGAGGFFSGIFSGALAGIKTAFAPITDWFQEKWDAVQALFKVGGITLPKIKLPHFSVSWSSDGWLGSVAEFLGLPGIPRLSVSWNALGGVFDKPTVLQGVGEAGAEAVVPLENNLQWLDKLAGMLNDRMGSNGPVILQVDGKTFGQISVDSINSLTRQRGSIPLVLI